MIKTAAVIALLVFVFAAGNTHAATTHADQPDKQMLQMMDLLKEMEMIRQIDLIRDIPKIDPAARKGIAAGAGKSAPAKPTEAAK